MSSYTRGKKRENFVFVPTSNSCLYGFKVKDLSAVTGVSEADITALGHLDDDAALATAGKIKIVGASAPKPPRVTRKIDGATAGQQQSVSTFCAYDKIAAAQLKKWKVTKQRRTVLLRASIATRGSLTAIAELSDGSLYCFPMNKTDFETYGPTLALKSSSTITSDAERNKLVSGSSIPKPGKASLLLADGSTFSSFYSTDAAETAAQGGFDILSEEMILGASATP